MQVGLFIPCYIDQLYPQVGLATVEVLERHGLKIEFPTEQTFEVLPDTYTSSLFYVEIYDPVYGYTFDTKSMQLPVYRKVRVTVTGCDHTTRGRPEPPSILKYGVSAGRRAR